MNGVRQGVRVISVPLGFCGFLCGSSHCQRAREIHIVAVHRVHLVHEVLIERPIIPAISIELHHVLRQYGTTTTIRTPILGAASVVGVGQGVEHGAVVVQTAIGSQLRGAPIILGRGLIVVFRARRIPAGVRSADGRTGGARRQARRLRLLGQYVVVSLAYRGERRLGGRIFTALYPALSFLLCFVGQWHLLNLHEIHQVVRIAILSLLLWVWYSR